jgi:hypothetical protein
MNSKSIFVAVLLQLLVGAFSQSCSISLTARTDCGFVGVTQQQCESKGCCWQPVWIKPPINPLTIQVEGSSDAGIPWCYFTAPYVEGYKATNVQTSSTGLEANLILVQV